MRKRDSIFVRSFKIIIYLCGLWMVATQYTACDECSEAGTWCDGDYRMECWGRTGYAKFFDPMTLSEYDCKESLDYENATCVEKDYLAGEIEGVCVLDDTPCPEEASSVCLDSRVALCGGDKRYPKVFSPDEDCVEQGLFCVYSEQFGEASCAYFDELCSNDGDEMCDPSDPNVFFRCTEERWSDNYICPNGEICTEEEEETISCDQP